MPSPDIQKLTDLVNNLATLTNSIPPDTSDLSPTQRQEILQINRSISKHVQNPDDHILATAFSINLFIPLRTCTELGVFTLLSSAAPNPLTSAAIAEAVHAEELLIVRFMRAVCALDFADEATGSAPGTYIANGVTHAMTNPGLAAFVGLLFDNAARPKSNLYAHLEDFRHNGLKSPLDARHGPYQHVNDCVGSTTFDHWETLPGENARFSTAMKSYRGSRPSWYDWMDVMSVLGLQGSSTSTTSSANADGNGDDAEKSDDVVLLVDVAGGFGHDLAGFVQSQHGDELRGRVILQDLPVVIDDPVTKTTLPARIEKQKHDFFTPQPVKGAKCYFMHIILHDWPDEDCVKILSHLRDAMTPGYSQLLVNDAILPETNCPLIATAYDITMMAHHCGIERSELMWRKLVDQVPGLEVVKFWYPPQGEGIIQIVRTGRGPMNQGLF